MVSIMLSEYDWVFYIAKGIGVTLQYTILPIILGLLLGTLLVLMKMSSSKTLNGMASSYISVIRGTPLLLQLSVVYFAIPGLTGYNISAFAAGVIAFSCNSAAYIAEIIRAGINAVDKGQFEAAYALGVPHKRMMLDIILPQAIRNILPSLVNEGIAMIKESSIIAIIGEGDLMRRAQVVSAEQYTYMAPLLVAAACYYLLVMILSQLGQKLERHLHAKY